MEKTKLVAFYLPQFHTFPENDEWWGKGFTEWVNVKKAVPLFNGHNQPRIPLHQNYYDLSQIQPLENQMKLAEKYGLYGFCYYHYWFDGKLLLEKPLEKMLEMKKKIHYCFCWANEPWTRAWDGLTSEILMPQRYGNEKDWDKHFQYLLPFFKDSYYIKKDNKPVFVIYRTNNVPNCNDMILFWDKKCRENGFAGIYLLEEKNSFQNCSCCEASDGVLEFEPMYTASHKRSPFERIFDKIHCVTFQNKTKTQLGIFSYDEIWKNIVSRKRKKSTKQQVLGAFVDWDNTARKGNKGIVFLNSSPKKFEKYLELQMNNARYLSSDFIFINAWNEWGEGAYLEPDEKNGFGYLEALSKVVGNDDKDFKNNK